MTRTTLHPVVVAVSFAAAAVTGHAQSAPVSVPLSPQGPSAAPPKLSSTEQTIKDIKNPASWLSWGADFRVRDEYYDTTVSLSEPAARSEQNVIRFRARLWTAVTPVTNVTFNARLAAEPREWTRPAFTAPYKAQQGMEWRYGIVDNLNVKWNNIADQPLSLTAGRQDMMFGDFWNWWLVADGTPGDGSWTYFLDAMRVAYDAKSLKTKFDLVYLYQNARPDEWIGTLNAHPAGWNSVDAGGGLEEYYLTEQDEQGVIAYLSNKSIKNTTLDGYFIYKGDSDANLKNARNLTMGDDASIYTLGARVAGTPGEHWHYSLEGAYQFGEKSDTFWKTGKSVREERDLAAYGGNAEVSYLLRDPVNNQAHLVFEYLSGDDPDTAEDEMFDILWGRWPRYSELYLYSFAAETNGRIGQHNNLIRAGGGWTLLPVKKLSVGVYYNALFAPESTPTRAAGVEAGTPRSALSGDGYFRGHYAQCALQYTFSRHVKGHLWAEAVWEGDYYAQRDLMSFLRAEVMFTF